MNTRLQVEHPVTELVTGLDLVEQMIRVAAGEKLGITQAGVRLSGWAIEARVYAEDPFRNFMPSIGRLSRCRPPLASEHVRVDTGIEEGSEVSMYYDPMIAKLITSGDTREQAIDRMADALDAYYIRGVSHNISFLNALISHPRFREGRLSTNFIADEYPDGFHPADVPREDPALAAVVAAAVHRQLMDRAAKLSGQLPSHHKTVAADWVVLMQDEQVPVRVDAVDGGFEVHCNGQAYRVQTQWQPGEPLFTGEVNGRPVCVQVDRRGVTYRLFHRGAETDVLVASPTAAALSQHMLVKKPPDLSKFLLSPMPGLLVRLAVSEGQEVKAGEELAVVEAMKMENSLRASSDGVVARVLATQGQSLVVDQPIVEFE
jgi:propionyl-CoA carboxylase alpha chain